MAAHLVYNQHAAEFVTLRLSRQRARRFRLALGKALVCMAAQETRLFEPENRQALALQRAELRALWRALGVATGLNDDPA